MKINLKIQEKPISLDEYLNEDDIELSPFQFALEELSQYCNGFITIELNENTIKLDLFYDFAIVFDEIIESISRLKNKWEGEDSIWFSEQGSDFYFLYKILNGFINIEFKKGDKVGNQNKHINDFSFLIKGTDYITEWFLLFKKIQEIFKEVLNKKIDIPF